MCLCALGGGAVFVIDWRWPNAPGGRPYLPGWPVASTSLDLFPVLAEGIGSVNVNGTMVDAASIRIIMNTVRKAELIGI